MIASFGDRGTEDLYHNRSSRKVRSLAASLKKRAIRKLDAVNAAEELDDLRAPPGHRLKALKGDKKGYHSIRVNRQWRIIFKWQAGNAHEVSLTDYH